MRTLLRLTALLLATAIGSSLPVRAADLVTTTWTERDGLPPGAYNALVQSRDGYLWLGTDDGLVSFDGVRFRTFDRKNTPSLVSDRILQLLEDPDGRLWFVTAAGAVGAFRHGVASDYAPDSVLAEGRAERLALGPDSTLWVSTSRGLLRRRGGRWASVGGKALAGGTLMISPDRSGGAWVSARFGAAHVTDAGVKRYPLRAGDEAGGRWQPHVARDGRVWLATHQGLRVLEGDTFVPYGAPGLPPAEPWIMINDDAVGAKPTVQGPLAFAWNRGGTWRTVKPGSRAFRRVEPAFADSSVWFAIGADLLQNGVLRHRAPSAITRLLCDREGNLWFTTLNDGLFRLRPPRVVAVGGRPDSLARVLGSVFEDDGGNVWLGARGDGLLRVEHDVARPVALAGVPASHVFAGLADGPGRLLLGIGKGLLVAEVTGSATVHTSLDGAPGPPVLAFLRDPAGPAWRASDRGIARGGRGAWTPVPDLPHSLGAPTAMVRDGSARTWVATNGGGLLVVDGATSRRIGLADGLPTLAALALAPDGPHAMWVGLGDEGLARVTFPPAGAPAIARLGRADGLSDDTILSLVEDGDRRLWMGTQRGIAVVPLADLAARLEGGPVVVPSVFDEGDGMLSRVCTEGALRARDGRLWFTTRNGAVVLDPATALAAPPPPVAVIEELAVAGGRTLETAPDGVKLDARERSFTVRFTALDFTAPRYLRFRYRIAGVDGAWIEAGTRREATYGRVPPGRHRFEVQAGDRLGRWNPTIAATTIEVAPFWHETWAFRLAALAALVALAWAALRWRTRNLERRQAELTQLVRTRTIELEDALRTVAAQTRSLEDLDRAKSRFFANISHEFRTPLTLTLGPLEDVLSGATGEVPAEARTELGVALRNARRLLQLVNEILDLAKLESGRLTLAPREADLRNALAEWALAFAPLAERRRVRFDVRLGDKPLLVWFDRENLGKAVTNLLSNAFKFSPEGSTVELVAAAVEDGVRIDVRDHGPGIPAAERERIFERFYQVDETRRRLTPGTGIGLALAKELVEAHGARIAVESEDGAGATFSIHLRTGRAHFTDAQVAAEPAWSAEPLRPDDLEEPEPPPTSVPPASSDDEPDDVTTVLVVDDNAELRALVRRGLVPAYRVVEAQDGAEALALARKATPDLVVSDVMMPGMDGFELLTAIRDDAELDFVPVVLLTARAEVEDRLTGLRRGADDYVEKPFRGEELRARVDNLIAMRRKLRVRFARPGFAVPSTAAPPPATDAGDRAYLERLRTVLGERLGDEDFHVAELAQAMRQDRTQLFRRVKELLGTAPADLMRTARLERAAELLATGEGGVSEIAYAVGFKSVAHFSAAFRRHFGKSPTEFARSGRTT